MSDIVLTVEGLTKKYTIGEHRERYVALRDVLARQVKQSVKTLGAVWGNRFTVAAYLESEIVLVDEVLAVGDAGVIS